ncbi:MAG: hypothetical protein ACYDAC_05410 [Candidatus Dormibacteria bacterium]
MIAAVPQAPLPGQVVLAIVTVLAAALVAAACAHLGWRTRNWLYHLGTVGGALVVAGVAGQRNPVPGQPIGPWDAGIAIPVVGVSITPVCAAGLILSLVMVTLVLLFERVPDAEHPPRQPLHRRLEDDDSV